jgi:hypothetical protein
MLSMLWRSGVLSMGPRLRGESYSPVASTTAVLEPVAEFLLEAVGHFGGGEAVFCPPWWAILMAPIRLARRPVVSQSKSLAMTAYCPVDIKGDIA